MREKAVEAARFIREKCDLKFCWAIILGSGLDALADEISSPVEIEYSSIPHFPRSTVPGHAGKLICGTLCGKPVLLMRGRFHYYEGYETAEVVFPIRVFRELGVSCLLTTNAVGGLNRSFQVGDVMLVVDHVNLIPSPLRGPHDPYWGERFPSLFEAYDPGLQKLAERAAEKAGLRLEKGVLASVPGPQFETPAELRALRVLGADAVGMSVTPETIVARQMGMKVLAFSVITDLDPAIGGEELSHESVLKAASGAALKLAEIIKEVISLYEGC
ncbi:MAG: purine-nucleoside phosphorylase [Coprothermobacterota bacterium]|nr:purine-nucleoside phosphorylase [Coprothermobacterota bacterium]